jgi:hypothetical protein
VALIVPSVPVFDDRERDDLRPGGESEPHFEFLNRAAGDIWQLIRMLVEDWYEQMPAAEQARLRSDLRSDDNDHFRSAFNELYYYQVLVRDGWQIEMHPSLPGRSRSLDFRAARGDQVMYWEATTTCHRHVGSR